MQYLQERIGGKDRIIIFTGTNIYTGRDQYVITHMGNYFFSFSRISRSFWIQGNCKSRLPGLKNFLFYPCGGLCDLFDTLSCQNYCLACLKAITRYPEKIEVSSWRKGEITIINIIHPIKLNLGSNRIIGIPKSVKSKELSNIIGITLPQMATIVKKVKPEQKSKPSAHYLQNRAPLMAKPYLELPLGAIQPNGWLKEQLVSMKNGMTGHLDEIYPEVVGERNGWLGGDGDGWERGPYWIDGLLPLAYILDDEVLKAKVQPWIEWTLNNQEESGYLGPIPFETEPEHEAGLQRGQRKDWWPKMVMLKILQQHYNVQ